MIAGRRTRSAAAVVTLAGDTGQQPGRDRGRSAAIPVGRADVVAWNWCAEQLGHPATGAGATKRPHTVARCRISAYWLLGANPGVLGRISTVLEPRTPVADRRATLRKTAHQSPDVASASLAGVAQDGGPVNAVRGV